MPTAKDHDRYVQRAREVKAMLHAARDPEARALLEKLAESYDRLIAETDRIADLRLRLSSSDRG